MHPIVPPTEEILADHPPNEQTKTRGEEGEMRIQSIERQRDSETARDETYPECMFPSK
jgi:hypothetical protein